MDGADLSTDVAPSVLPDIPGQDPSGATASGAPIVLVQPQQIVVDSGTGGTLIAGPLTVDGQGNVITISNPDSVAADVLVNFESHLNTLWSTPLSVSTSKPRLLPVSNASTDISDYVYSSLATDGSSNIYVVGMEDVPTSTAPSGFVAQYSPAGAQVWIQNIPNALVQSVVIAPDGSIVVAGDGQGQLPNQPPTAEGYGFLARLTAADGTMSLLVQSPSLSALPGNLFVDPTGNELLQTGSYVKKFDMMFTQLWSAPSGGRAPQVQTVAASPDGKFIYDVLGQAGASQVVQTVEKGIRQQALRCGNVDSESRPLRSTSPNRKRGTATSGRRR